MTQIKMGIQNCEECPHSQTSRVWTADSFETVRKVHCNLLKKDVHPYLDWHDKLTPIPNECPSKIVEEKVEENVEVDDTKDFDALRSKLDGILDDYYAMSKEQVVFEKMKTVYGEMRDLLEEMRQYGELDRYNTKRIFEGIEELGKMGL
ncbi:hypothetical protein [Bacillus mycoides]|uniref:hypothetical protein n=1 Tax=Bacillus mycoides TaxID=1405 RepID=UPI001E53FC6A|nr:hypothetical protein [Bacillus mycoides]